MCKEIMFGNAEIEKRRSHLYKNLTFLKDVDIDKILISNKTSSGEKNYKRFIGYLDGDYKIMSLHIMIPKMSTYI